MCHLVGCLQRVIAFRDSPKSVQQLPITERQQVDTLARLPNFPLVKPRDIIVEAENRRWRVVKVSTTERLRHVVHQELQLHEITKGDIEFQLPIRKELENFEPSPRTRTTLMGSRTRRSST